MLSRSSLLAGEWGQLACFFNPGLRSLRSLAPGYNPWPLQGQEQVPVRPHDTPCVQRIRYGNDQQQRRRGEPI